MRRLVEERGCSATVIDLAPLQHPSIPGLPGEEVFQWKGSELSSEKERIMEAMGSWATERLLSFYREGKIDGVIGLGGNQGSAVASMAMRVLPFGFPKYLVSTVASGNIRPYVGCKDIGVIFSVGDFLGGPNAVTRSILANAVSAVIGMVEHGEKVTVDPAGGRLRLPPWAIRNPQSTGGGSLPGERFSGDSLSRLRGRRFGHGGAC